MVVEFSAPSGLLLMFLLGLRHGLDPDHIACIDSLTWRAVNHSHAHAKWVGTLFAVGHGLLVTAIAVLVGWMTPTMSLPPALVHFFDWVPTGLLVVMGVANLRQLLLAPDRAAASTPHPPAWLPGMLRGRGAWSVVVVGVLFGTVFDTATQAAAWGYVASNMDGGAWHALDAGLAFTAGMVVTDTVDGRIVHSIGNNPAAPMAAQKLRRVLGSLVVAISLGVALYNLAKAFVPGAELGEFGFSLAGGALVLLMLMLCAWGKRALAGTSRPS